MFESFDWCCSNNREEKRKDSKKYYNFLAPSVYHLQTSFLDYMKENDFDPSSAKVYDIENLSTDEPGLIRSKGIERTCPIDGEMGAAYVHCIEEEGEDHVGLATHMLSYTWGYVISDIVDTLLSYCTKRQLDTKRTYVWICCLCNNQHRIQEQETVSFEDFHSVFNDRVRGIGNIIAMMAPWDDPGYLKRVWCVFELYASYSDDACEVDIAMPPREQHSLIEAMKLGRDERGNWGIDKLLVVLANSKVENAQASIESDKKNIFKLIEDGPSFKTLNQEVNQMMKSWIKKTVIDSLEEDEASLTEGNSEEALNKRGELANFLFYVAFYLNKIGENEEAMKLYQKELVIIEGFPKDSDDYKVRKATCSGTIGMGYFNLQNYEKALEGFETSLKMNQQLFGTQEHQRTASSIFNIGVTKLNLKDLEGALECFQDCVRIYEKLYGTNHIYTADSYDYVGRVFHEKEDIDKALEMYNKALDVRISCRGANHPDIAVSANTIGLLFRDKEEYTAAIASFNRALEIWESVHGPEHYDVSTTLYNMGLTYFDQREMDEALTVFSRAKSIREMIFGSNHPETKSVEDMINRIPSKK